MLQPSSAIMSVAGPHAASRGRRRGFTEKCSFVSRIFRASGAIATATCLILPVGAPADETRCELLQATPAEIAAQRVIARLTPLKQTETSSFSAYLVPAGGTTREDLKITSVFPWFNGETCLLQLMGWPRGISGQCDLLVEVKQNGATSSFRVEKALTVAERRMDVALLVDDSYSMRETDPDRLRLTAVRSFADMAAARHDVSTVSVISFARKARLLLPPTPPTDELALLNSLKEIKAEGRTDMDLAFSLAAMVLNDTANARRIAVVLSDGRNEPGRYRDSHRVFSERGWPVYAIGLSGEADVGTLKRIARETGGKFFYASKADELAAIFQEIALSIHHTVKIADWPIEPGGRRPVPVDESISLLSLGIGRAAGNPFVALISPSGGTNRLLQAGGGRAIAEVAAPPPGMWAAAGLGDDDGVLSLTAASDLELIPYPVSGETCCDNPIQVACLLARGNVPVAGAHVTALFEGGGRRVNAQLFDDGAHGDGRPGDGIYGAILVANFPGTCRATFSATGRTAAGYAFERAAGFDLEIGESKRRELWLQPQALNFEILPGDRKTADISLAGRGRITSGVSLRGDETRLKGSAGPNEVELPQEGTLKLSVEMAAATNCQPGKYEGTLTLALDGTKKEVPLSITVLVPPPPPVAAPPPAPLAEIEPAPPPEPVAEPPEPAQVARQEPPPATQEESPQEKKEVAAASVPPQSSLDRFWFVIVAALVSLAFALLVWLLLGSNRRLSPVARCAFASACGHMLAILLLFNMPPRQDEDKKDEMTLILSAEPAPAAKPAELPEVTPAEREIAIKEKESAAAVEKKLAEDRTVVERQPDRPDEEAANTKLETKTVEQAPELARKDSDVEKKSAAPEPIADDLHLKAKLAEKQTSADSERQVESAAPVTTDSERPLLETKPAPIQAAAADAIKLSTPADDPTRLTTDPALTKSMTAPAPSVEDKLAVDTHSTAAGNTKDLPESRASISRGEAASAEAPAAAAAPGTGAARTMAPDIIGGEDKASAALPAAALAKQMTPTQEVPVENPVQVAAKRSASTGETGSSAERRLAWSRVEVKSMDLNSFAPKPPPGATNTAAAYTTIAGASVDSVAGPRQAAAVQTAVQKSAAAQTASPVSEDIPAELKTKTAAGTTAEKAAASISIVRPGADGGRQPEFSGSPVLPADSGTAMRRATATALPETSGAAEGTRMIAARSAGPSGPAQIVKETVREELATRVIRSSGTAARDTAALTLSVGRREAAGRPQVASAGSPVLPGIASRASTQTLSPVSASTGGGEARIIAADAGRTPSVVAVTKEAIRDDMSTSVMRRSEAANTERGMAATTVGRREAAGGRQDSPPAATSLPAASSRQAPPALSQVQVAEVASLGTAQVVGPATGRRAVAVPAVEEIAGERMTAAAKKEEKGGQVDGARTVRVSGVAVSHDERRSSAGGLAAAAPKLAALDPAKADLKPNAAAENTVPRLAFSIKGSGKGAATALVTISLARHAGDWDCSPTAMKYLAHQLQERSGMAIETSDKLTDLASPDLMKIPFVYMTGHKDFVFSEAEVKNLRKYLEAGGSLWGDDSTDFGDDTFDRAFRREVARILPDRQMVKLGMDFHGFKTGYDLTRGYKGYAIPPGDKYRLDYLEGVTVGDRIAVVYSRNDYGDGLNINPDTHPLKPSLTDLGPTEMQEGAVRMGINLILYFVTSGGKAEAEFLGSTSTTLRETADAAKPVLPKGVARVIDALDTSTGWNAEVWGDSSKLSVENKKFRFEFTLGDKKKAAASRQLSPPIQLSRADSIMIDAESRLRAGSRVAIGLTIGNRYYESQPFYLKPGANTAFFKMSANTFKNEETKWEYKGALGLPATVDRISLIVYSPTPGEILFHNLRVAGEK
ncbi:MAG: hypothetical protein C0404_10345 [Verrucomicrobia bacterium]|nr:hypothetical protein [Verrucomicrobiota bacterium]